MTTQLHPYQWQDRDDELVAAILNDKRGVGYVKETWLHFVGMKQSYERSNQLTKASRYDQLARKLKGALKAGIVEPAKRGGKW